MAKDINSNTIQNKKEKFFERFQSTENSYNGPQNHYIYIPYYSEYSIKTVRLIFQTLNITIREIIYSDDMKKIIYRFVCGDRKLNILKNSIKLWYYPISKIILVDGKYLNGRMANYRFMIGKNDLGKVRFKLVK